MSDPKRIRSIKPEYFSDPVINAWSPLARIMYVGLWTISDDCGRFRADEDGIMSDVAKKDRPAEFEKALAEIINSGKVLIYEVNKEKYGVCLNWWHQKIDETRFKSALFPCPPDEILIKIIEHAANNKRFTDDMTTRLRRITYDATPDVRRMCDEYTTLRARARQGAGSMDQGAGSIGDAPPVELKASENPSLKMVQDQAVLIGLAPAAAEKFFRHFEASGWKRGSTRITHWQSALAKWKIEDAERLVEKNKKTGAAAAVKPTAPVGEI